jgi:hypothetical protein
VGVRGVEHYLGEVDGSEVLAVEGNLGGDVVASEEKGGWNEWDMLGAELEGSVKEGPLHGLGNVTLRRR